MKLAMFCMFNLTNGYQNQTYREGNERDVFKSLTFNLKITFNLLFSQRLVVLQSGSHSIFAMEGDLNEIWTCSLNDFWAM